MEGSRREAERLLVERPEKLRQYNAKLRADAEREREEHRTGVKQKKPSLGSKTKKELTGEASMADIIAAYADYDAAELGIINAGERNSLDIAIDNFTDEKVQEALNGCPLALLELMQASVAIGRITESTEYHAYVAGAAAETFAGRRNQSASADGKTKWYVPAQAFATKRRTENKKLSQDALASELCDEKKTGRFGDKKEIVKGTMVKLISKWENAGLIPKRQA
jgi:hypothetical protein